MKASEIMKKYNITRPTLSAWVKENKIKYIKLPNGRYEYEELNDTSIMDLSTEKVPTQIDIDTKLALIVQMAEVELDLLIFLRKINFMGPELMNKFNDLLNKYKSLNIKK